MSEETKTETKVEAQVEKKEFSVSSLVGMSKDDAVSKAKDNGYKTRVVSVDGKGNMLTTDVKSDRIGLTVQDGKITKAEVG